MVDCDVLADSRQILEDRSGHSDTEPTNGTVCGTDFGQTVGDSSGHSDTEPTGGTM